MNKGNIPEIEVGIMKAERVQFLLKGRYTVLGLEKKWSEFADASINNGAIELIQDGNSLDVGNSVIFIPSDSTSDRFLIADVMIGIGFHWEQKEDQEFQGALKLLASGEKIQVVNVISVEDYLISVISSEMRGDSSAELLRAHTIISRSWLLAQIEKQEALLVKDDSYEPIHSSDNEYIRWYDREDHGEFHVCADDHCQRYQGTTRATNLDVEKAVIDTAGKVLVYNGAICDARYSKCCGGVVEEFKYCWEPVSHPYLKRVDDNPASSQINTMDLKVESNARQFIEGTPEAFCNTSDVELLGKVLNDYDQSSKDFFRWKVTYSQDEISALIREKSGFEFGDILDLVPVERGESGRLVKLKIIGTRKTLTIGKELEIRRWLSSSHLYSSAFIVERQRIIQGVPRRFILHGAGWGHGVGLCQIGAAVMASKGYTNEEILTHYFIGSAIEKRYEQN
ncbi:MAG: amidase [Bacteroidetes bacterium]|nr:MAG: amidase [Bacteroidota bacterium]